MKVLTMIKSHDLWSSPC